jgi:hypothetical protein
MRIVRHATSRAQLARAATAATAAAAAAAAAAVRLYWHSAGAGAGAPAARPDAPAALAPSRAVSVCVASRLASLRPPPTRRSAHAFWPRVLPTCLLCMCVCAAKTLFKWIKKKDEAKKFSQLIKESRITAWRTAGHLHATTRAVLITKLAHLHSAFLDVPSLLQPRFPVRPTSSTPSGFICRSCRCRRRPGAAAAAALPRRCPRCHCPRCRCPRCRCPRCHCPRCHCPRTGPPRRRRALRPLLGACVQVLVTALKLAQEEISWWALHADAVPDLLPRKEREADRDLSVFHPASCQARPPTDRTRDSVVPNERLCALTPTVRCSALRAYRRCCASAMRSSRRPSTRRR